MSGCARPAIRSSFQELLEILPREAFLAGCNLLRCAAGDDCAAAGAALRAKVQDIICYLDDVKIVLNDKNRIAGVDQTLQNLDELVHVRHVQAGCRLVENVERAARRAVPRRRRAWLRSDQA